MTPPAPVTRPPLPPPPYRGNDFPAPIASKRALLQQSISLATALTTTHLTTSHLTTTHLTTSLSTSTSTAAGGGGCDGNWGQLKDKVATLVQRLSVPEEFQLEEYKFQILSVAVLPYMHTMQGRVRLEPRRFNQIKKLLYVLCEESGSGCGSGSGRSHPAEVLLILDEEVQRIKAEEGWWQSELGTSLQGAVELQWIPILNDYRKGLRNVGEKLVFLGIIELIRPAVLIYPAWMLLSEASTITEYINTSETLGTRSVMQVIKAILFLCISLLQLKVVSLVPGIGYPCLGLGIACYFIAQSDSLLKPLTPALADNLYKIDQGIDMLTSVQKTFLSHVNSLVEHKSTNNGSTVGDTTDSGNYNNSSDDIYKRGFVDEIDVPGKEMDTNDWETDENFDSCDMSDVDGVVEESSNSSNLHSTGIRKRK